MAVRLGVAAVMAAVMATLAVLIVRAIIDPPQGGDVASREAFLFQTIAVGVIAGLGYQLAFRWRGLPGYGGGLVWGAAGFIAVVLAPLLSLPGQPAGFVPVSDGGALLFWLFTVAVSIAGLGLLWAGRGRRRLLGIALLLAPPLMAPTPSWQNPADPSDLPSSADLSRSGMPPTDMSAAIADPAAMAAAHQPGLILGLTLLFWLLLGGFSVLAARRIVESGPGDPRSGP
ncbi:MAG TPA: hypothetical protein VF194_03555 [Ferrovibrio sp.]|jgi:hypothetical protein|uniref:hypothetical protein n=1 Tax=Ferrovibrio sp. TaxID=1917215 RepID=UPI002ED2A6B7